MELNTYRTKSREGPLQGSIMHFLSQLFAASPVKSLDANQWLNESGIPAKYTQVISLYFDQ